MRTIQILSGAALVALLTAGCASNSDSSESGTLSEPGTSAPTSSPSASPAFDKAAATATAKSALLKISDFPAGWSSAAPEADEEGDEAFEQKFADCLKAPNDLFGDDEVDSASEDSLDFKSPDENTTVSSSVAIAVPGKMRQFFDLVKGDDVSPCLAQVLDEYSRAEMQKDSSGDLKGVTLDKPTVGQLSFPTYGDETAPLRVSMSMRYSGLSFEFFLDIIYVRVGDNGVSVMFEGTDRAVPVETEQKYVQLATDRLTAVAATPNV